MAAETGIPSVYLEHQLSHVGRGAKKTKRSLIDRLRHCKSSHSRSWNDSIKTVRSCVGERRSQTDASDSTQVQHCLDTLQKAMKVISPQTLKERLDLIGRQLGLSVQIQEQKISLGMDAFHVEVLLGEDGVINSVKLANQGDVMDCPDLKDILKRGNFSEFVEHLQGLQSIYQVTSDEKLKSKAFLALQALEKDLNQLAQFQNSISGVANYIHKCPLGIMLPRLAGKPMKLIYFVSPYDLLDKKSLTAHPLTVEAITENFLGQSVTVCIEPVPESAPLNKLQTMPLMNVSITQDGKSLPSFSGVSQINSMMLPASFVLVLPQSIPVSSQILQKITSLTNLEIHKEAESKNLHSLILENFSNRPVKDCHKLLVSLPDQQHIYFLNGGGQDQQGVMISRIPFTHPTHVPKILSLMRQQLLFNIVIASCIRTGAKKDTVNSIVFEVSAVSLQQLTIVFEHPAYDTMITVDIDLTDITNLKCRVTCTNTDHVLCSDEAVSRVFQRCMSIPIMLRWLISKGQGQLGKLKEAALAAERERMEKLLLRKEMHQRLMKSQPASLPTKGRPPPQPPHPPPLPPPPSYPHQQHPSLHHSQSSGGANGQSSSAMLPPILAEAGGIMTGLEEFHRMTERSNSQHSSSDGMLLSPDTDKSHQSLLSNLLEEEKQALSAGGQQEVHDSPMLSRLLDDNTSVATTVIPMNCKPAPNPPLKRQRKRRSQSDFSGPSPKHRFSDSDSSDRLGSVGSSVDLDLGPSISDQVMGVRMATPPNVVGVMAPTLGPSGHHHHHHHHSVLNHSASSVRNQRNVIDLTEENPDGESSIKKLTDSVERIIHKDVKAEPDLPMVLSKNEAAGRIPTMLQNSPSGSKNENASTSLEGYLKGSGEVGRAKDYDPSDAAAAIIHGSGTHSKLSSLLLAPSDSPPPVLNTGHKLKSSFFSDKHGLVEAASYGTMGKVATNSAIIQDIKPSAASLRKGQLRHSSSMELVNDKQSMTGIFEKFDVSRQLHPQTIKSEVAESDSKVQHSEGKVSLKLRVGPLKQQNNMKPTVKASNSFDESEMTYGKPNSSGTFDFKSDEDDDSPFMNYSDRYVYSASPTRLQISTNKQKRSSDPSFMQKVEKPKKKEKSSGNTTKRKREKDESKREKKRKKTEHIVQESVYRTVENDQKADFKFKIRVAKKPVSDKSDSFSDSKGQSYEISKKISSTLIEEKALVNKQDVKEMVSSVHEAVKEKDMLASTGSGSSKHVVVTNTKSSASHKSSVKPGNTKVVGGNVVSNKTDPKLVTKATIRLKPLTMPNSGSTVNVSQSGSKNAGSSSASMKQERRSSTSASTPTSDKRSAALSSLLERRGPSSSSLAERRGSSQSLPSATAPASAPVSTTAANLSLSSILPNAPTVSKVASLPRIPKRSSSSSNTSINRTSSLDPASGTSPASAGTKSNNSYTIGPGGRPNPGTTSGTVPGGGRLPGNNSGPPFNYSNRPAMPGSGASSAGGGNRANPGFNANRGGVGTLHRQPSPLMNSPQMRPQGPVGMNRTVNSTSGSMPASGGSQKTGPGIANSHKAPGNAIYNSVVKGNAGSSNFNNPNVPQKPYGSGAKLNSSISSSPKNGSVISNSGQKFSSSGNNSSSTQKHGSGSHMNNSSSRPSQNSSVTKSPNTQGVNKSPNYGKQSSVGKSPTVSGCGKSPNLHHVTNKSPNTNSVNKSPNISGSGSGRSPNTNSSRSPSLSSSSNRSSSSSVAKPSSSGTTKQSQSGSKVSNYNKSPSVANANKSQHAPTTTLKTTGSNNKMSPTTKTILKTTETSSISTLSSSQSSSLKPALSSGSSSVNKLPASTTSVLATAAPTSSISSPSTPLISAQKSSSQTPSTISSRTSTSSQSSSSGTPKATATPTPTPAYSSGSSSQPPVSSPSSVPTTAPAQLRSISSDQGQNISHKGSSKPSTEVTSSEKLTSCSSTPTTPLSASADNKNKFSFPASRGRKNSLSAIVDKLKNKGSTFDSIVSPSTSVGNQSNISNKVAVSSSSNKYLRGDPQSHKDMPDENEKPRSPNSDSVKIVSTPDTEKKNFSCVDNGKSCNPCPGSAPVVSTNQSGTRGSDKTPVGSDLSQCDKKPTEMPSTKETEQSFEPNTQKVCPQNSESVLEGESMKQSVSSNNVQFNKTKEKWLPPAISTQCSAAMTNVQHAVNSSRTPSPSPTTQSPQSAPSSRNNSPRPPTPTSAGSVKKQKDFDENVFKIPSVKAVVEPWSEEDKKTSQVVEKNTEDSVNNKHDISENDSGKKEKTQSSSERKSVKSVSSPLSDISSPENGLVIDDEESPRTSSKAGCERSISSASPVSKLSSPVVKGEPVVNSIHVSEESRVIDSPQNATDLANSVNKSTKSPALGPTHSGASTPKGSDSPCEIDDDLMDVALGFIS